MTRRGRIGTPAAVTNVLPLSGLRVDQRSLGQTPARPRRVTHQLMGDVRRCWRCGQVPRQPQLLEPEGDDWRCTARRACDQRGPDPLRGGQV